MRHAKCPMANRVAASVCGAWRGARTGKPPRTANDKSRTARCGGPPHIFLKNYKLCGDASRNFIGSGVPNLFFVFLALPVEVSSLLISKKCYILRFVSKDLFVDI